jgi:hypothetical protein
MKRSQRSIAIFTLAMNMLAYGADKHPHTYQAGKILGWNATSKPLVLSNPPTAYSPGSVYSVNVKRDVFQIKSGSMTYAFQTRGQDFEPGQDVQFRLEDVKPGHKPKKLYIVRENGKEKGYDIVGEAQDQ